MPQPKQRILAASIVSTFLMIGGFGHWLLSMGNGQTGKQRKFVSKTITSRTPGHAVDINVDVSGAKKLFLVVTDAGNGYSCDWADWAEPRLVGPKGELKLTELKWKSAESSWGQTRVNKNAAGGPLKIAGKPVEYGIGTHAHSVIVFDIPKGYTHFKSRGGLDNGGTNQGNGKATSVQFHVYLDDIPQSVKKGPRPARNGGLDPDEALEALEVADGLEATIFAAEPMLLSPTNIDIDAKGRVWVCEVVNYRGRNGTRKEGDRILILDDTDGDGKADTRKVYYQGRDVDSAMGICVLGNKVIVSCSPNVFVFTDENGDDIPDQKELLFAKTGQPQHDHSAHAFIFGPDGKLYWNFGNYGRAVHDKNGEPVVDLAGNKVIDNGQPYRGGMVFRCDMDGSNFEVLGHNFRNNYEVAVDSFGTLWQSDNDDDGNRGVRINYVMEFGNYGYRDEITGAGWKSPRTGMAEEIPKRHWHLNDPGVVPNLLQTGQGSPTGICVYEAPLLPKQFWNEVIHADAGPNIVRAYPAVNDGAGYEASIIDILRGARDKWFRPSDVCVAPDGSLFIADWYDPGVGGHRMGDIDKGRIFRVAPPKAKYNVPKVDCTNLEGAIEGLKNPALSVRYLAWRKLHESQVEAEPALLEMFDKKQPAHYRARALWLLGKIKGKEQHYVDLALADANPDIRIVGVRMARQLSVDLIPVVEKLLKDRSPQVRRELAIALRHHPSPKLPQLWAELAAQHDGKDRWYLEALGIGADRRWDPCFEAWLQKAGDNWNTASGRDVVWRSRAAKTPEYLAKIIAQESVTRQQLPRYFRAFDFQSGSGKEEALIQLAFGEYGGDEARQSFIRAEALARLKNLNPNDPKVKTALNKILEDSRGTTQFIKLVEKFGISDRYPDLMELALKNPESQLGVDAIVALLAKKQFKLVREHLNHKKLEVALATAKVLGAAKDAKAQNLLLPVVTNQKKDLKLRREAVRSLAEIRKGALELVSLARSKKLDPQLKDAAAAALHRALWRDVKTEAIKLFPLPAGKDNVKLPPISALLEKKGNAERGKMIFRNAGTCATCHIVNNFGKEVGPNLSEIGDKLSRQAMFESILFPSAAISHNYEAYLVELSSGNIVNGLLVSQTPTTVTIKDSKAIVHTYKKEEIEQLLQQPISLMPADLAKTMSVQEMVDVVEYLATLRKPKVSASND